MNDRRVRNVRSYTDEATDSDDVLKKRFQYRCTDGWTTPASVQQLPYVYWSKHSTDSIRLVNLELVANVSRNGMFICDFVKITIKDVWSLNFSYIICAWKILSAKLIYLATRDLFLSVASYERLTWENHWVFKRSKQHQLQKKIKTLVVKSKTAI